MKIPSRPQVRRTFHVFDYLWWTGERLSLYTKADGVLAIWGFFIPALFPFLALCADSHLSSGATAALTFTIFLLILPLVIHRLYPKPRRQAVMRHYSKRPFRRLPATMLCLLPYIVLLVEAALIADHRHRAEIEKEQQTLTVDKELQKYIKRNLPRATTPFPELNLPDNMV